MTFPNLNTLIVSFSGGKTSAYMAKLLIDKKNEYKNIIVIFANTGCEHEETLKFINNCDLHFGFKTVWVEAKVNQEKGLGTGFKITNYKQASRNGEPFEDVIKKYGIPFIKSPHCTRELKRNPILAYIKNIGLSKKDYLMAIGIRVDEVDRISPNAEKDRIIYPLIKNNVDKKTITEFWKNQKFNLMIPEHFGNCTWCWKKSFKKLITLMNESQDIFEFPERMEKQYGMNGAVAQKIQKEIKFFRGFKSVDDIRKMALNNDEKFIDKNFLELTNGCSESCEVF